MLILGISISILILKFNRLISNCLISNLILITHINSIIWIESIYRMTVNHSTMGGVVDVSKWGYTDTDLCGSAEKYKNVQ